MERLTTNKPIAEMNMMELAYNCCYMGNNREGRYRDFTNDIDIRSMMKYVYKKHFNIDLSYDNDEFDQEMYENLIDSEEGSIDRLVALFYRNLWVMADLRETLKNYEDLEEQGLLLKLPCKIGDTVYQLINSHIYEYKVIGICFDIFQNKWMYEVAYQIGLEWFKTMCDFDAFGKSKTVFLTREEAEKASERLECAE